MRDDAGVGQAQDMAVQALGQQGQEALALYVEDAVGVLTDDGDDVGEGGKVGAELGHFAGVL